ncbi:MAG: P-type conjugative transfer protein TrbG [Hyphomonas sp.]|uniref:P-type conjugative transfer protein TrbG n=1 Tax=Hyphomonas sp. TaxID=87 RepID=UPI00184571BC|nr:P-type conjugative transfer protein TrbG [Hyphomonas sp.]MBU3919342.1 P-type conjugative transfer protein TrbG [Alphaproteobacteria bacterium]MBA3069129.1 P-type conjugative transfer protein TrbG [Hyphomonas sp.]MBU4061544.1 P-type conjugative transfer protein TrbG [Alphaproteobacteria bacterium]MBU4165402.1 P-type conjugative transfer protein TrbG [Alphaproteobacteria bacterium]MBU4567830.1 P-type conjugative transfer protein TrbG [Alphaproteobacteria bacterium]
MTRLYLPSCALLLATACASVPSGVPVSIDQQDYFAAEQIADTAPRAVEVVETPVPLPLPGQLKPLTPSTPSAKPVSPVSAISQGTRAARVEPTPDGYVNAVQIYPYTEGALYQLYTSPSQVSDIALQPGERLVSVSAGDTVRWVVGDTQSGSGPAARAHVLVKPVAPGLTTNLMIATDRRTYHLELTSLETSYMAALSWHYPADALSDLNARNARAQIAESATVAPDMRLEDLNFDYQIEGARPAWRPVRVFDDGRHVFIQMPDGLSATDAPPLFVLGPRGEARLVNYRVKGSYYIVDYLFAEAELRLGQKPQTAVQIRRKKSPRPRPALSEDGS